MSSSLRIVRCRCPCMTALPVTGRRSRRDTHPSSVPGRTRRHHQGSCRCKRTDAHTKTVTKRQAGSPMVITIRASHSVTGGAWGQRSIAVSPHHSSPMPSPSLSLCSGLYLRAHCIESAPPSTACPHHTQCDPTLSERSQSACTLAHGHGTHAFPGQLSQDSTPTASPMPS